jgi:hypothetical protein
MVYAKKLFYQVTVLLWIRNMKEELFSDAQQILDYYHLCENVSNFAKVIFDNIESNYRPWTEKICQLLKNSQTEDAKKIIKNFKQRILSKSSINLLIYLENNKNNIGYKKSI